MTDGREKGDADERRSDGTEPHEGARLRSPPGTRESRRKYLESDLTLSNLQPTVRAVPTTTRPPRRTQAERRSTTRAKLLDAVLEELVESGYGNLTTPAICRRAGLSQGALFKHFPTKAALVAAAVEFLFAALVADYGRRFAEAAGPGDPLRRGVALLWDVFQDPRLVAAYDLYTAARTDAELRASLEPVVRRHADALHALAAALYAPADDDERARLVAVVDLAILAMQGLVLNELATGGERRREELPPLLVEIATRLLPGTETRR